LEQTNKLLNPQKPPPGHFQLRSGKSEENNGGGQVLTKHGQNPVAVARSEGSNQARLVYFIIFYSFIYFAHFFGGYSGRIRGVWKIIMSWCQ